MAQVNGKCLGTCGTRDQKMIDSIEHRISVIKYACVISAVLTMQSCGNRITNVSPTDPIPLADALSGEDLYNERCANCHDGPVARAPHKIDTQDSMLEHLGQNLRGKDECTDE